MSEALPLAQAELPDAALLLVTASNSGGSSSVQAQLADGVDPFMDSDGRAAQWVFEFYRDEPTPISEGDRQGFSYPFERVLVNSGAASMLPQGDISTTRVFEPLPQAFLDAAPAAYATARAQLSTPFDQTSIASFSPAPGQFQWLFRFYEGDADPTPVLVSGDGTTVLPIDG